MNTRLASDIISCVSNSDKTISQHLLNKHHFEELFKKVFNAGVSMLSIRSVTGRFIEVNRNWLLNTGYTKQEVIGMTERDINLWADDNIRRQVESIYTTGMITTAFEVSYKTKNGEKRTGLLNIGEIDLSTDKFYLEEITDITEQKRIKEEMAKIDKLNLIGQMAAGISHEFRNPITTIRGFVQMLSGRRELNNIKEYFDIIIEEIDRTNSIITEFLTLSKSKEPALKRNNINLCIERLFPLIQANAFNDDKDVKLELSEVPDIYMDEGEIRQLILNLTQNAIEASPLNGTVTIASYYKHKEVVLEVKDEGKGIEDSILHRIGTPFITTKEDGTGMGLVICYDIAERHNAKINFDTGSQGTSFYVRFKSPEGGN